MATMPVPALTPGLAVHLEPGCRPARGVPKPRRSLQGRLRKSCRLVGLLGNPDSSTHRTPYAAQQPGILKESAF